MRTCDTRTTPATIVPPPIQCCPAALISSSTCRQLASRRPALLYPRVAARCALTRRWLFQPAGRLMKLLAATQLSWSEGGGCERKQRAKCVESWQQSCRQVRLGRGKVCVCAPEDECVGGESPRRRCLLVGQLFVVNLLPRATVSASSTNIQTTKLANQTKSNQTTARPPWKRSDSAPVFTASAKAECRSSPPIVACLVLFWEWEFFAPFTLWDGDGGGGAARPRALRRTKRVPPSGEGDGRRKWRGHKWLISSCQRR